MSNIPVNLPPPSPTERARELIRRQDAWVAAGQRLSDMRREQVTQLETPVSQRWASASWQQLSEAGAKAPLERRSGSHQRLAGFTGGVLTGVPLLIMRGIDHLKASLFGTYLDPSYTAWATESLLHAVPALGLAASVTAVTVGSVRVGHGKALGRSAKREMDQRWERFDYVCKTAHGVNFAAAQQVAETEFHALDHELMQYEMAFGVPRAQAVDHARRALVPVERPSTIRSIAIGPDVSAPESPGDHPGPTFGPPMGW